MRICFSLVAVLVLTTSLGVFAQPGQEEHVQFKIPEFISSWADLFLPKPVELNRQGILESVATAEIRPGLTGKSQLGFLPQRGGFTFPEPYNTQAIRLTNASDCGGDDCVQYVGYSYWSNINNHLGQDSFYVLLGLQRGRGGLGANIWQVDKETHKVTDLGPMFSASNNLSYASTEGWYFSSTLPTKLYATFNSQLRRYDILTKDYQLVLDVTDQDKAGPGHILWQTNTNADDNVHVMTIRRNSDYQSIACAVYWEETGNYRQWPVTPSFDECHIDLSGNWLHIIDDVVADRGTLDNVIINLRTMEERILLDENGAGGHGGHGYGGVVQADNWSAPNAYRYFDYSKQDLEGTLVYLLYNWQSDSQEWRYMAPSHISFLNARPDSEIPIEDQYACGGSAANFDGPYASEIICFRMREVKYRVDDDGSYKITKDNDILVVAPTMTDATQDSLESGAYGLMPKGNLDVTGEYFIWTSNTGGANGENRLDAFIVKIPDHRFQ